MTEAYYEGFKKTAEAHGLTADELTKVAISLKDLKRSADLLDKAYAWADRFNSTPAKMSPLRDILLGGGAGGAIAGGLGSLTSKMFGNESNTNSLAGAGVGAGLGTGVALKAAKKFGKVRNPKIKALATALALMTGAGTGGLAGAVSGKVVG